MSVQLPTSARSVSWSVWIEFVTYRHLFTKESGLMRSHACFGSVVVAALALTPGLAWGGEQKDEKTAPKMDLPGPVHKQLSALAGTWDVTTKFKMGGKEQEGKARCVAKMILDGRFLQQEYESKLQGKPYTVIQL